MVAPRQERDIGAVGRRPVCHVQKAAHLRRRQRFGYTRPCRCAPQDSAGPQVRHFGQGDNARVNRPDRARPADNDIALVAVGDAAAATSNQRRPIAAQLHLARCGVQPQRPVGGGHRIARLAAQMQRRGQRDLACRPGGQQGGIECRPVRTDLDGKVVRPCGAHLGAARKPGLEQQACRVRCRRLVDLDLMPGACMRQQGRRRRHRQPVCGIRGRRNPKPRHRDAPVRRGFPHRTVEHRSLAFCHHLRRPACQRHDELPPRRRIKRDPAGLACPKAGRPDRHDMAVPDRRRGGRHGQVAGQHRQLHHHVQKAQRLVVGDVLLRLRRQDQGQLQDGRGVGHGACPRGLADRPRLESHAQHPVSVPPACPPFCATPPIPRPARPRSPTSSARPPPPARPRRRAVRRSEPEGVPRTPGH